MDVLVEAAPHMGEIALSLDVGYWVIDLSSMRVYWPRGLGIDGIQATYGWTSLQAVSAYYPDGERQRFRGFIEELVRAPGETKVIHINASGPEKSLLPLRMAGRLIRNDDGARIYGMLEVFRPERHLAPGAAEPKRELAKSIGQILDSFFVAAQAAAIVFDRDLHVWRASSLALKALHLKADDAGNIADREVFAALPKAVAEGLTDAIRQQAGTSGVHAVDGRPVFQWRIQSWGRGEAGAGGAVLMMTPVVETRATASRGMTGQKLLEGLRAPLLVVSAATGEVDFANSSARSLFHMKNSGRYFVRNLVEICGHAVPSTAYDEVMRGANFVNLKMGARVMKTDDRGEELLIEYLH